MKIKFIALFFSLSLLLVITACSSESSSSVSEEKASEIENDNGTADPINIGVSFGQNVHPFFVAMQKGIEQACADSGIEDYTILSADSSLETQVSQIENLIVKGCDVILLNPYDSDGVINAVKAATEQGVKVITMDVNCNGSSAFVASDNYVIGTMLAEYIIKELNGEGKVAIIDGITVSSLKDRTNGFIDGIADTNIELVAEQQTAHAREAALASAENILQANPDIDAFIGINENAGMAILSAITSAGLDDLIITTVDATAENMIAIRDKKVDVGVSQNPFQMGYIAVEQAIKVFNGEVVEEFIEVPVSYMYPDDIQELIEREEGYGVKVE